MDSTEGDYYCVGCFWVLEQNGYYEGMCFVFVDMILLKSPGMPFEAHSLFREWQTVSCMGWLLLCCGVT